MTSANKSLEKKRISYASRLRLEQLLRIFRALQTSRVLRISMNARWRMNQLLNFKFLTFCIILPYINISSPLPPKNGKKKWNKYKNWQYRASLVFCEDTRFVESIFVCFVTPEQYYLRGDGTKAVNKLSANFSQVPFLLHDWLVMKKKLFLINLFPLSSLSKSLKIQIFPTWVTRSPLLLRPIIIERGNICIKTRHRCLASRRRFINR